MFTLSRSLVHFRLKFRYVASNHSILFRIILQELVFLETIQIMHHTNFNEMRGATRGDISTKTASNQSLPTESFSNLSFLEPNYPVRHRQQNRRRSITSFHV